MSTVIRESSQYLAVSGGGAWEDISKAGPQLCPLISTLYQLESSAGTQQAGGNSKLGLLPPPSAFLAQPWPSLTLGLVSGSRRHLLWVTDMLIFSKEDLAPCSVYFWGRHGWVPAATLIVFVPLTFFEAPQREGESREPG